MQVLAGISAPGANVALPAPGYVAAWDATLPQYRWQDSGRTTQAATTGNSVQVLDDLTGVAGFRLSHFGTAPTVQGRAVRLSGGALYENTSGLGTCESLTIVMSLDWLAITTQFARIFSLASVAGSDFATGFALENNNTGARSLVADVASNKTFNAIWTPASLPSGRVTLTVRYRLSDGRMETRLNGTVINTVTVSGGSPISLAAICLGTYYNNGPQGGFYTNFDLYKMAFYCAPTGAGGYLSDALVAMTESWAGGG